NLQTVCPSENLNTNPIQFGKAIRLIFTGGDLQSNSSSAQPDPEPSPGPAVYWITIMILTSVCLVQMTIISLGVVCYRVNGPGNLVRVHGIMNALKYQDILKLNLVASARKLKMGRHWVFQQDNDPKHTAKSTQKWFTTHRISTKTENLRSSTIIMVTTLILMLATCAGTLSEPSRIYMSVTVGSSAVLPCDWRNKTSSLPSHIEWRSIHQTILERRGEELFQGEGYERRVDVPEDKLLSSDCSLMLRNIRTSDAGLYESYLLERSPRFRRVPLQSVELSVEGKDIALLSISHFSDQ
ncbi:hypothetical protein NFI96_006549, partial [Prochilodus magdalenae]